MTAKRGAEEHFTEMARRIEANAPGDFAGAVVIVDPTGKAISLLSLDPSKDEAAFWAVVSAKVDSARTEFQNRPQTFPGFR